MDVLRIVKWITTYRNKTTSASCNHPAHAGKFPKTSPLDEGGGGSNVKWKTALGEVLCFVSEAEQYLRGDAFLRRADENKGDKRGNMHFFMRNVTLGQSRAKSQFVVSAR